MPPVVAADAALVLSAPARRLALAILASALALDIVDGTIVNVAIPAIQSDLGAGDDAVQWIVAAYTLGFALLLIVGGRLGDAVGYRRMFVLGVAGFTVASVCCGGAPTPGALVAARAAQGAMAAMMAPQGAALLQILYPPHERAAALGVFGAVGGASAVLGPILGGFLVQADLAGLSWRPVFLINAPLGLLAAAGGLLLLPGGRSSEPVRPDAASAALLLVPLLLIMFPVIEGAQLGWPPWLLAAAPAAAASGALLRRHVLRVAARDGSALIAPEMFDVPAFVRGSAVAFAFQLVFGGYMLCYTLTLQLGLGYSPLKTALTSIPFAASVGLAIGVVGRRMAPRLGRSLVTVGALAMAAGLSALALLVWRVSPDLREPWTLLPWLAVAGLGMGLMIAPLGMITLSDVDVRHAGLASGVLSSVQQAGTAMGVALGGAVFFGIAAQGEAGPAAYASAFAGSVGVDVALLLVVASLSRLLPRTGRFAARPEP